MDTEKLFRKDYSGCTAKEFLADESFVVWIKQGKENMNLDLYWKTVMDQNPDLYEEINKAIEIVKILSSQEVFNNDKMKGEIWKKIQDRISRSKPLQVVSFVKHYILQYQKVAAVLLIVLLLAGAAWSGFFVRSKMIVADGSVFTTIYSPAGQKTEVTLPDKSKVWLNSKTTLRYSSAFNIEDRHVYLDGEAFFDVAKESLPFEVLTAAIHIQVLGTAFNVKCYSDEEIVEATLVRGSMKVEKLNEVTGESEEILLRPNQKVVFARRTASIPEVDEHVTESRPVTVREAESIRLQKVRQVDLIDAYDTEKSTGWKDGLLIIDGETLSDLSKKIERRYDVQFIFLKEELKDFKYTGTLQEYSLEQVLKALEMTSPISYNVDKQIVYIDENKEATSDYMKLTNRKK
ncbi:MAG TPA: FecR domain-containing protein [Bacteroidales bacterium]|nr:FecR domain-containing protein [Bacteroidales bacterium]